MFFATWLDMAKGKHITLTFVVSCIKNCPRKVETSQEHKLHPSNICYNYHSLLMLSFTLVMFVHSGIGTNFKLCSIRTSEAGNLGGAAPQKL